MITLRKVQVITNSSDQGGVVWPLNLLAGLQRPVSVSLTCYPRSAGVQEVLREAAARAAPPPEASARERGEARRPVGDAGVRPERGGRAG